MATKWKKWKSNLGLLAFVLGVSLLITGGMGLGQKLLFQGGVQSIMRMLKIADYQESQQFRDFIACRLNDFLNMASGEYVDGYDGSGYSYMDNTAAWTDDALQEAEITNEIQMEAQEEAYVVSGSASQWEESERFDWEPEYTDAQKKASAKNYHKYRKRDKNLLYRISYAGKLCYTNAEESDLSNPNEWPKGYNFYLHFDGKKAVVQKDGKALNIYGDGYYREGDAWRLPGYKNLTGKESWKKADVVILAAEQPALYSQNLYGDELSYWVNELYFQSQNYEEMRRQIFFALACLSAGAVLLVCYLFLREGRREIGQRVARVTGKIWFEWKILLLVALPVVWFVHMLEQDGMGAELWAYATELGYAEVPWSYATQELSGFVCETLFMHEKGFLLIFWAICLFVNDLRNQPRSYRHGLIGRLVALLNSRDLTRSLAKRMVRRPYGIFALTLAQIVCFLCVLFTFLIFGNQMSASGLLAMGNLLLLAALAMTALLLASEIFFQKKNRGLAFDLERLSERISSIRDGNYDADPEFTAEDPDVRHMTMELEEIRQGLETAVEEQTRSERMKVELVANVSHDIKTPLTSIISYIQLMKQEEGLPEYVADYIRILDEKSERLKNMVQDVFAISKAASGQLAVDLEELDLGKLLYQTLADMEEAIGESPVSVKTEIPKDPVPVLADGQRMYRVFQNLIGNAIKYSLEGSRVYVALKAEGELAVASVKNTSSQELDHGMDFAGRFTRGDQSRTDGGSGLGLSIAKSFTEACGGTFQLEVIADLFVVTVSLPLVR